MICKFRHADLGNHPNAPLKPGYNQPFFSGKTRETLSNTPGRRPISEPGHVPTQPHESTVQALELLCPRLSPGGYCIVDGYHAGKRYEQAFTDYRAKHGFTAEVIALDGTSAMWCKR